MTDDRSARDITELADRGMRRLRDGDVDGAQALFVEIEATCADTDDPAPRVQLARARNGLGFCHLLDAKRAWAEALARERAGELDAHAEPRPGEPSRHEEFVRDLRQALALFNQALAMQTEEVYRLSVRGNVAYAHALLGDEERARALWAALFADGGEGSLNGLLFDANLSPVPEDDRAAALARAVWKEVQAAR